MVVRIPSNIERALSTMPRFSEGTAEDIGSSSFRSSGITVLRGRFHQRRVRLLETTETEEKAMAKPAAIGCK